MGTAYPAQVIRLDRRVALRFLPSMSPEPVLAKPVDARSDPFSLADVLQEMVACTLPFAAGARTSGDYNLIVIKREGLLPEAG